MLYYTAVYMETEIEKKIDNFVLLAHELKTNLVASKWLLDMFENGDFGPIPNEQKEALIKIREANDRMLTSINESLFMFRNGITEQLYRLTPCDIDSVLTQTIEHFKGELSKKGMKIDYKKTETPINIYADYEKIRIVFQNIIDNAIKYGNPTSTITIVVSSDADFMHCKIENMGIGIPKNEQGTIFKQFFRASNSEQYEAGSGIGLYGTKQIIEHHRGEISFESEEQGKTVFTISIPLAEKQA